MKQATDKFTKDAFASPRRGRPPSVHSKTHAQRQSAYRARQRQAQRSSDPKVMAAFQRSLLNAMSAKLLAFSADWGDVDELLRSKLEELAFEVSEVSEQCDYILSPEFGADLA